MVYFEPGSRVKLMSRRKDKSDNLFCCSFFQLRHLLLNCIWLVCISNFARLIHYFLLNTWTLSRLKLILIMPLSSLFSVSTFNSPLLSQMPWAVVQRAEASVCPQASRLSKWLPDLMPCKAGPQLLNAKLPVQLFSPDSEEVALPCYTVLLRILTVVMEEY